VGVAAAGRGPAVGVGVGVGVGIDAGTVVGVGVGSDAAVAAAGSAGAGVAVSGTGVGLPPHAARAIRRHRANRTRQGRFLCRLIDETPCEMNAVQRRQASYAPLDISIPKARCVVHLSEKGITTSLLEICRDIQRSWRIIIPYCTPK
jgi:hypothetical protein